MWPRVYAFIHLKQKDFASAGLQGSGSTVFTVKYTSGGVEAGQGGEHPLTKEQDRRQAPSYTLRSQFYSGGEGTHIIKFHTYKIITLNSGIRDIWL